MSEIGNYEPGESCGAHFTHYKKENCEIADGVGISGLIDTAWKVIIEKDAFSGHDVMILTASHDPTKFGEARKFHGLGGPITIHEGVWIGTRAIILGPCEIGKNAVIAAGAIVVHDVPEYALVAGNPAVVKKYYDH